ncbi:secreted RxLR effector protein 161-like [Primulina tabacum]|uniref:secreted RxLR effector protein 161-like n=1 Tax=Primulina tabacum TaxID=48773 RepID=UPI003F599D09
MCHKTDDEIETMRHIPYAYAIGNIIHGMISSRHDIAIALSVTRRYQSNSDLLHWKVVKDIRKCLRRTKNLFIVCWSGELKLEVCVDSNFQSNVNDSKLTFGFVFKLNGVFVSWNSSKKDITANSTTESEYLAASATSRRLFG